MVAPEPACANLRRLVREGRLNSTGFMKPSITPRSDCRSGRKAPRCALIWPITREWCLLSLAYLLFDRPMQRRFESDPAFRATDLLLQERVPKAPSVYPHPAELSQAPGAVVEAGANFRVFTTPRTAVPEVHLLSNGNYHVAVTAAGGGYSRWRNLADHPMAGGFHPRLLGHLLLPPQRRDGRVLVGGPAADRQAAHWISRRSIRRAAQNSAAATATSTPTWRSAFLRRTTLNCAASPSPIADGIRARSN